MRPNLCWNNSLYERPSCHQLFAKLACPTLHAQRCYQRHIKSHSAHCRAMFAVCRPTFLDDWRHLICDELPSSRLDLSCKHIGVLFTRTFDSTKIGFTRCLDEASNCHCSWFRYALLIFCRFLRRYQYIITLFLPRPFEQRVVGSAQCSFGVRHQ